MFKKKEEFFDFKFKRFEKNHAKQLPFGILSLEINGVKTIFYPQWMKKTLFDFSLPEVIIFKDWINNNLKKRTSWFFPVFVNSDQEYTEDSLWVKMEAHRSSSIKFVYLFQMRLSDLILLGGPFAMAKNDLIDKLNKTYELILSKANGKKILDFVQKKALWLKDNIKQGISLEQYFMLDYQFKKSDSLIGKKK
ncbi:MAG: hypothetical protein HYW50_02770 [Candidatus Diapherotrites archaeon]|nr:hypothetical protein [Candidatus Diapherotrites archaeon]